MMKGNSTAAVQTVDDLRGVETQIQNLQQELKRKETGASKDCFTATQHNTTQHNTTQHNATQHNTTQHNTTQHNTTQDTASPPTKTWRNLWFWIFWKMKYSGTSLKWVTTSPKRPPLLSDHLTKIPIGSSVSQIAICETSRKRPPKPDIKGGRLREVPL